MAVSEEVSSLSSLNCDKVGQKGKSPRELFPSRIVQEFDRSEAKRPSPYDFRPKAEQSADKNNV